MLEDLYALLALEYNKRWRKWHGVDMKGGSPTWLLSKPAIDEKVCIMSNEGVRGVCMCVCMCVVCVYVYFFFKGGRGGQ